jgi:hypothetical protein
MSGNCSYRNPHKRSGTAQYMRVLEALLPSNAKIDERTTQDLMLFAKKYASYLNYYNIRNEVEGDWTAFMSMDISVVLANLSKQNVPAYKNYLTELFEFIDQKEITNNASKIDLKNHYKNIYDVLYTLFYFLDECLQQIPEDIEFYDYYKSMVESRWSSLYLKIEKYRLASIANNLILSDSDKISKEVMAPFSYAPYQNLIGNTLSASWHAAASSADVSLFDPNFIGSNESAKIKNTIHHNLFTGLIEQILKTMGNMVQTSKIYFDGTIESFPKHTPHYGLYLVFLRLFRYSQDSINQFSTKHLDFYYKEVLRLNLQDAINDRAHIILELSKNASPALLTKGTTFKAGKDVDGLSIYYELEDDIIVNSGSIAAIKSTYTQLDEDASTLCVYASAVSNSEDGIGAELISADKSWTFFGDENRAFATYGFALAHPHFYLQEATREIQIMFLFDKALTDEDVSQIQNLKVKYTTEKGWENARIDSIVRHFETHEYLIINISLGSESPAVKPYSEDVHLSNLDTNLPTFYFELEDDGILKHNALLFFEKYQLQTIEIYTRVYGYKGIVGQNQNGAVDTAKSFPIFGVQPHIGSSFIFGSHEVLLKNRQHDVQVTLNIEWDQIDRLRYGQEYEFVENKPIRLYYLQNGDWEPDTTVDRLFFNHIHKYIETVEYHYNIGETLQFNIPNNANIEENFEENKHYKLDSKNGFYKIELAGTIDFGHNDYMQRVTQAAIDSGSIPQAPYTPAVKSISLDYTAQATIDLTNADASTLETNYGKFLHIHPFGNKYVHSSTKENGANFTLLPINKNEGEFFIGIDKFNANQSISILFKLAEGTADPNLEKQDILWYYLGENDNWVAFDEKSLIDNTLSLTQTGIVKFPFSDDAQKTKALMGSDYFWIRAIVASDTAAICKAIQLHAQAATIVFSDADAKGNYFKSILPEGTISKLVVSNSSIKSIAQPYNSFDGVEKESDTTFFHRVSERLRHKQRAITIWDYERLALQQFPSLYRVKCINHTMTKTTGGFSKDYELTPGHVMVIAIPDLKNQNARDPLKPQTDLGTLLEIEHYLRAYTSPHVNLQVKNAKFEEIQLSLKVKFYSDDTAYYHDVLLADIEKFLSPWAYNEAKDVEFGGSLYKSVLINYIEELSYVDYLTCVRMYHIVDGVKSVDIDEATSTTARSIFVSYGGDETKGEPNHNIEFVESDCNC